MLIAFGALALLFVLIVVILLLSGFRPRKHDVLSDHPKRSSKTGMDSSYTG